MRHGGVERIDQLKTTKFDDDYSKAHNAHAAVFAEVKVDEELGVIRVTRVVSAVAGGRILNAKTAHSQIMGAVVWGIGMALHEQTVLGPWLRPGDERRSRGICRAGECRRARHQGDLRGGAGPRPSTGWASRASGEIGIVGVAAAIANAVYHATGTSGCAICRSRSTSSGARTCSANKFEELCSDMTRCANTGSGKPSVSMASRGPCCPSAGARTMPITSRPARRDTHRPVASRPPPSASAARRRSSPC